MPGPLDNLPQIPLADRTVTVLAVSPHETDRSHLKAIFNHSKWRIFGAECWHDAKEFLKHNRVAVVICESILPDGNWKRLLKDLPLLPAPPLLIVTSNHADDALWAETLSLGAYDVLAKPFEKGEVTRIISLAWLHWKEQRLKAARKPV